MDSFMLTAERIHLSNCENTLWADSVSGDKEDCIMRAETGTPKRGKDERGRPSMAATEKKRDEAGRGAG